MKKTSLAFALAMTLAVFATAASKTYKINLTAPAVVAGVDLKPGSYKLAVDGDKMVVTRDGKELATTPVKVEEVQAKFSNTGIGAVDVNGKRVVNEIQVGGSKTKLVLPGAATASTK